VIPPEEALARLPDRQSAEHGSVKHGEEAGGR
jgi:hypothetical protein